MPRASKPPIDRGDAPLKRLGGGRWQTRDERFTIEPQSGTWVIVDGDQTDDFGMPLVRGPFPSLTAAKDGISSARSSEPAPSPLAERIERRRQTPAKPAGTEPEKTPKTRAAAEGPRERRETSAKPEKAARATRVDEPNEPGWLTDLAAGERGRARRLIARLAEDDIPDAEGIVRRDVVGDVPALAAAAIARRLADLGPDATPDAVADLLAEGRDERLDVRWRLVDGEGRPIVLDRGSRRRR
jgi:hypothetical protein